MFATGSPWDDGLDDAQLAAVTHGSAPLVVAAGAGTGKTRTLTARVACLLDRGVAPERLLLLTFTRRAADDMLARAAAMVGHPELARRLRGGTFHAVAHQVVRTWPEALGVTSGFSILDRSDAADVMELVRDELGLAKGDARVAKGSTLVDVYSRCVNTGRPVSEVVAADFPWCEPHLEAIGRACQAYVARKRARGQLDLDDLLLYWRAALSDDRIAEALVAAFDHVLVDEYQDVNALQVDIVRRLRPAGVGLTVVGDDAQAIYGFRGADAAHLWELAEALPDARVVRLERNFRSCQPVLEVANRVRPRGHGTKLVLRAARPGGRRPVLVRCHDAPCEARAVVDRVLDRFERGTPLRDQAVLVRAAHHSDLIELELTLRRVPFRKYGGLRFLEAAHVKDYVAALRLLDNPLDDVAWFRLLRLHEGIGPARARRLLETLPDRRLLDPPEGAAAWAPVVGDAPPPCRAALASTVAGLAAAREREGAGSKADAVLAVVGPLVAARYAAASARLADLERLAAAATAVDDLDDWMAELTLDPPASTSDYAGVPRLDEDYVVVSTVHSAKGLEWPVVHVAHLVDGAFPSDMALRSAAGLEEERRLFYVATTRARDELLLYVPMRMPHHRRARDDRHSLAVASRFLDPAVSAVVDVEEVLPARPPLLATPPSPGQAVPTMSEAVATAVDLDPLWA